MDKLLLREQIQSAGHQENKQQLPPPQWKRNI